MVLCRTKSVSHALKAVYDRTGEVIDGVNPEGEKDNLNNRLIDGKKNAKDKLIIHRTECKILCAQPDNSQVSIFAMDNCYM